VLQIAVMIHAVARSKNIFVGSGERQRKRPTLYSEIFAGSNAVRWKGNGVRSDSGTRGSGRRGSCRIVERPAQAVADGMVKATLAQSINWLKRSNVSRDVSCALALFIRSTASRSSWPWRSCIRYGAAITLPPTALRALLRRLAERSPGMRGVHL